MKKTSIRFLAILLTVFLLVSIFPLSLFAANSSEDPPLNSSLPDESATPTEEESSQDRFPEESSAEVSQTEITGSLIPEEEPAPDGASTPNRAPAAAASFTTLSETVLPDGIYAFRNLGNTNRWMDVEQNRTTPGYHIQQYAYSASPAEEYGAAGLFKVTQVGTTGRYIIRLMLNTNLTFGFSGDEVITKTIPASDASVSASDTFYIRYNNGGFTIQPSNNSTYYVAANNTTASGMGGAPDSFLAKRTLSAAGNRARWAAEGYQTQIPNGVYAFRNLGNTNRWMDVQNNGTDPGYRIQQYAYGSSPAGGFNRPGLFKVSQVGSTGRYVVRLMLNNELSFGFSGTGVVTKKIPASDASVSTSDTFYINFNNGSYIIRPASETENYVAANNTTASGAGGAPDSYLAKRTLSSAGDRARWILERYTGSPQYGYIPSISAGHSQNLVAGEQVEISLKVWSTVINVNTPYISVNSGSSYVTTSWNSSSNKLSVLARDAGTVQLKLEIRSSSPIIYNSEPYSLYIKLPIEEGFYLFQNKELGNFMQIDNDGLSKPSLNGVNMELWDFDYKDYMHWQLVHVGEGYYKILSAYCGLAVGVNNKNVNENNESLLLEEYYNSNRQKWKITKTSSGSYVLRPQSGEAYSTDWCMAASSGFIAKDGRNVEQRPYTSGGDAKDEWILVQNKFFDVAPVEEQQMDYWCWVAAARMFAKHYYPGVTYTQSQAVSYVKGSVGNTTGSLEATAEAISYYISNISGSHLDLTVNPSAVYSQNVLKQFFDDGHVVIIGRGGYSNLEDSKSRNDGHIFLICGYVETPNGTRFIVRDPGLSPKDSTYLISYEKLYNGRNHQTDENPDQGIWEGCIVINTSYASKKIPNHFNLFY